MARRAKAKKPSPREAQELENYKAVRTVLEEQGWQVNLARTLGSKGGHCVVHGQRRVILKSQSPTAEKVDVLIDALQREDLGDVDVPPVVQALLDAKPMPDVDAEVEDAAAEAPKEDAEA